MDDQEQLTTFGGYSLTLKGMEGDLHIQVEAPQPDQMAVVVFTVAIPERLTWRLVMSPEQAAAVGRWLLLTCGEGGTH